MVRDRDGRPQEDRPSGSALLLCVMCALSGDLLGISRSIKRVLLSVQQIYPRIFLHVFIVYRLLIGFLLYSTMFMCVSCLV